MAKKKGGKRRSVKLTDPVLRKIPLGFEEASQQDGMFSVPACLSITNSRLYRQGRSYRVRMSLSSMNNNSGGFHYKIFTLPDNWFTHGAIRHAWMNFRASMQDELAQSGGTTSKWFDFIIGAGSQDGTPTNNKGRPAMFDGNSFNHLTEGMSESFTASTVTDSDGDEMTFAVTGLEDKSGAGYYNIMLEYARWLTSRRSDTASAESGPQSYEGLLPDAADLDRLYEDGDTPPYDESFSAWHGGADAVGDTFLQQVDTLNGNSNYEWNRTETNWFNAPLGLVWVFAHGSNALPGGSTTATPYLSMEAAPGSYKGVQAQPIYNYKTLVPKTMKSSQTRNPRITGIAS